MQLVLTALDDLIELPAGAVPVLGRELGCEQRKFRNRIVRDEDQRPGDRLAVVIDALDGVIVVARPLAAGPVPTPAPPELATPACSSDKFRTPSPIAATGRPCVCFNV